jgi:predicted dehydrogenase
MRSRPLGIGVIGFGWMGQTHSRSFARIPALFPDRTFDPRLVICADSIDVHNVRAIQSFGFREASSDWRAVVDHPDVDVVVVCSPNMLHVEMCTAAAAAGKHIFCEKPVGGTPEQTAAVERAAREAGVISGVGYNYRWAPLVQHARQLIAEGELGHITNYRGRFFSSFGSDPRQPLSWRFRLDQAGYGVSTDMLSHAIDMAHFLLGSMERVVGDRRTFIPERPLPSPGGATEDGATGAVTNEDYASLLCRFECGASGTFEASRTMVGPHNQMAFEVYGTKGSLAWNFETMNELQVFVSGSHRAHDGYVTVLSGDRYPFHGLFMPGDANSIGYEELTVIEAHQFLTAVAAGEQHEPGFREALRFVEVQDALVRSWGSGTWEDVRPLSP